MTRSKGHGAPSQRQLRVGEEIRHLLVSVLGRDEVRDPDLAGKPVTVTEVRISPDLKNATAFVVPLGGGDGTPLAKALNRAAPFLRGQMARELSLKFAPRLSFQPDQSFDNADRIDALLQSPEVLRDLEPEDAPKGDGEA